MTFLPRALRRTLLLAATMLALSPPSSHACDAGPCYGATPTVNHAGWVQAYNAVGASCAASPTCMRQTRFAAWKLSVPAGGWVRTYVPFGSVYVYPFTSQWRWGWTREQGWFAFATTVALAPTG